jgi:hypothetical protein
MTGSERKIERPIAVVKARKRGKSATFVRPFGRLRTVHQTDSIKGTCL